MKMEVLEDDPSGALKVQQVGLGLINYNFKCVVGGEDFTGQSFRLSHAHDGQVIGSYAE